MQHCGEERALNRIMLKAMKQKKFILYGVIFSKVVKIKAVQLCVLHNSHKGKQIIVQK